MSFEVCNIVAILRTILIWKALHFWFLKMSAKAIKLHPVGLIAFIFVK